MRYFKCNNLKPEDREFIAQDIPLTEQERKSNRQGKFLNSVAIVLASIVFLTLFFGSEFMIVQVPVSGNPFSLVLAVVGMIISTFGVLIGSILIGSLVTSPIFKKAQKKLIVQRSILIDKALISLREYYGWKEPCVVTKCYDSSDQKFKNRDMCIFLADDELRLSADLKYGFSIRENDLGCYVFQRDEISVEYIQGEQFLITELKSGDVVFRLGRRAKGFIERNFISV